MLWMLPAAFLAYFVKGLCGFANTLIFSTLLSFVYDNVNISPVELLVGYPANLVIAWRERRSINWRICLPVSLLVLLGNIPGVFLLKNADTSSIKSLFGLVIMAVGIEMLLRERRPARAGKSSGGSRITLAVIGLLSGLLCGLYGIGALLAAYMSRVTDDSSSFRGNLCAVFLTENTFRLILYASTGILTLPVLKQALCVLPAMGAGLGLGLWSGRFLREQTIRRITLVLLIISGAALLLTQLRAG